MKIETNLCMYSSTIIVKLIFLTIFFKFGEVISGSNPNGIPSHPPQSGTGYYRTENISVENWVDIGSLNDVTSKIGKLKTKIKINTGEVFTKYLTSVPFTVCASFCKAHNQHNGGELCNAWKIETGNVCKIARMTNLIEYTLESQRQPFYVEHTEPALETRCRGGNNCCNLDNICQINEGDCDVDEDCFGLGLICGTNNCIPNDALFDNIDDCCTGRCSEETPCVPGDGQCQSDNDCIDPEFNKC